MSYIRTPEIREKQKLAALGKTHSLKTREKLRQNALRQPKRIGWHHYPKTLEKLRLAALGNKRAAGNRSRKGQHNSPEHNAKIQRHRVLDLPNCPCAVHTRYVKSKLEMKMVQAFLSEFPDVRMEVKFGRFRIDAYLPPPYHLAFEADGKYWHGLPGHRIADARRDDYLLSQFGIVTIRLGEDEINHAYYLRAKDK